MSNCQIVSRGFYVLFNISCSVLFLTSVRLGWTWGVCVALLKRHEEAPHYSCCVLICPCVTSSVRALSHHGPLEKRKKSVLNYFLARFIKRERGLKLHTHFYPCRSFTDQPSSCLKSALTVKTATSSSITTFLSFFLTGQPM